MSGTVGGEKKDNMEQMILREIAMVAVRWSASRSPESDAPKQDSQTINVPRERSSYEEGA